MPASHAASHPSASARHHGEHRQMLSHHYPRLVLMTVVSFAAMYGLMYAMVDSLANVSSR